MQAWSDGEHRDGKPMDEHLKYAPTTWRRNLVLIAVGFVSMLAVLYSVQADVVMRGFEALEHSHARRDLERAANAVDKETSHLEGVAADWASWDDTYEFIIDGNQDYAASNLVPGTFEALGINLIAMVDLEGNVVHSMAYDLEAAEEVTIPEFAIGQLEVGHPLLIGPADGGSVAGIYAVEWGPMLVASQPILTSDDEGPSRGCLIMGRLLTPVLVRDLSDTTQLEIQLVSVGAADLSEHDRAVVSTLRAGEPSLVKAVDAESLLGHALLPDVDGNPILLLTIDLPRDVFRQGQASLRYLTLALALSGGSFLILLSLAGRRTGREMRRRVQAQRALRREHDELEQRVVERTAQLSDANASLEREVVERERIQQRLEKAVQEKELLLKELHHRVKNSLQVISSLLYVHSKETDNPEAVRVLKEAQQRVRSIALVYESMKTSAGVARVEFLSYARAMASELLSGYREGSGSPSLVVEGDAVYLPSKTAVLCGLAANELITNALKHAFPNGREGQVRVGVRSQDGRCTLEVCDDGVGLPKGWRVDRTETAGLRLVNMLVRQVNGHIEVRSPPGTCFSITFPVPGESAQ